MDDEKIIQLYLERKEEALKLTSQKYGVYCDSVARQFLQDEKYLQECVNDVLLAAWLSIPSKRPASLQQYLGELTKKIAKSYAASPRRKKRKHSLRREKQKHRPKSFIGICVYFCIQKMRGCLKYIPALLCIGMTLFAVYGIVGHVNLDRDRTDFFLSASADRDGLDQGLQDGIAADFDSDQEDGQDDAGFGADMIDPVMPARFDAYEGPALTMTATGDTQNVKTTRKLQTEVTAQYYRGAAQPLLHVLDCYQIKNTSNEDKALQLVYPFATTLNLSYGMEEGVLTVQGQKEQEIEYGIGDGISAFFGGKPYEGATLAEYTSLSNTRTEYQENALQKAMDWNREVCVYFLTDIQVEEGSGGVVGVSVTGEAADVLTYGFDYAAPSGEEEDRTANYCFFAPTEYARPMLIVTGQQEGEPKLGYYSNLDCEDEVEGIRCTLQKRKMSYADALHLCSQETARKTKLDYDNQKYTGKLPEYFDEAVVYQALTVISTEDDFYDTLVQRYQKVDLEEIFETMLEETRLVYAMATVTIPAKKTLKVTAQVQKRQADGNYALAGEEENENTVYQYDFASAEDSRLNIKKTVFQMPEPEMWKATAKNPGLEKRGSGLFSSFKHGVFSIFLS